MSVLSTFPMGSTATGGGGSGVHVGADAPTDESINLWIDTDETESGIGLTQTVSLAADDWADNAITVTVDGVTTDNMVIVSPHPDSFTAWGTAVIRCTAQASNSLTFACDTPPTETIKANLFIVG